MTSPKTLVFDIETSPNLADVWALFNQNVSLNQLRETSEVLCFAWKWHGASKIRFASQWDDGREAMIATAYELLDEADIVVHYNGDSFDLKHLRREFLLAGYAPYSSVASIDLLRVMRGNFRFASNKLDHISKELKFGGKVKHAGHSLWTGVMAGDEKARKKMETYNKGDVRLTDDVYTFVKPWIHNHPHLGHFSGDEVSCPRCGSTNLQRRGYSYTGTSKYARVQCQNPDCMGWSRLTSREGAVKTVGLR